MDVPIYAIPTNINIQIDDPSPNYGGKIEKFSLMIFKCMIKIIMKDVLIKKILGMNTLRFKSLYYLHVFNQFLTKSLSISFF